MFDPFFKKKTAFLSGISFQFRRSYFVRAFGVFSSPTLFLEGNLLNSYSLLKHRRWQSKKIPTNVWPFLFCQALSNWENYYCPTPQPHPDLQNFRQAKKIYMNLVFEIFLKYSFYCKNETSNLELKSWSTLCPYAPAEKLFSLVIY